MKTNSRIGIGTTCRVAVLSSLVSLASLATSFGQEPLALDDLKLVRPPGEACTITFGSEEGQQIMGWSSPDLECWIFAGVCDEVDEGLYQFVDPRAIELPDQFYRFETFNPEVPLPPQFEQLRMELGDENFAQWLQSNLEESGTLQGIPQEEIENLNENNQQQVYEIEDALEYWLKDFRNDSAPVLPDLELPPLFEEVLEEWGAYDFGQLLVGNLDQWGNYQGICEPLVIEWELNEPIILEEFRLEDQKLELWVEDYLAELPPVILENFAGEEAEVLPPQYEQLRLEMGNENFADWLRNNHEESGNLQGVNEHTLPSGFEEEFAKVEEILERWLGNFENQTSR